MAFNQIQYDEEDARQRIEEEEFELQFEVPQRILQYLEFVMRQRLELDELENLEWVRRQGLVNDPGDGGGPLALARKGEAAMNLRVELTNLEDTEQRKRKHADLLEGLEVCGGRVGGRFPHNGPHDQQDPLDVRFWSLLVLP